MKYYETYDSRYKTAHENGFLWMEPNFDNIILETIEKYDIDKDAEILDMGCGEGRNCLHLLKLGYNITGTDCSTEAIETCKKLAQERGLEGKFCVIDSVANEDPKKYDFIYSIAVLHMLLTDEDRLNFLENLKNSLKSNGIAMIAVEGDGKKESATKIEDTFQERDFTIDNKTIKIAAISLRIVNWEKLNQELETAGLEVIDSFVSDGIDDFDNSMIAIVRRK